MMAEQSERQAGWREMQRKQAGEPISKSLPSTALQTRFVIEYREEGYVGLEYEPVRASTAQEAYAKFMELYPDTDVLNVLVPAFHGDGSDYIPPLPR